MIIRNLLQKTALFIVFVMFTAVSSMAQSNNSAIGNNQDPPDVQAAKQAGNDQDYAPKLELSGTVGTNNTGQNTGNNAADPALNQKQIEDLQASITKFENMLLDPALSADQRTAIEEKLATYKALLDSQDL